MIQIHTFTFNPFQENTYVLSDDTGEAVIIDPGCYSATEQARLSAHFSSTGTKPVKLLLTHAHIDHVFGNAYVHRTWKLLPHLHRSDLQVLKSLVQVGQMYGVPAEESPEPGTWLEEGDTVTFGNSRLEVLFTPGHSPGSVVFVNRDQKFIIGGDVLFQESIGRTDLPGGSFEVLEESIRKKLYTLPDDFTVYPGHGPSTTIGHEKAHNPFVTA